MIVALPGLFSYLFCILRLLCLCRVETLESLPVHSFNGVIISSTRVCTLQSPFIFLFLMILIYTSLKVRYLPVFVSRLLISYFTFLWTCIRLSYVLSVVAILCMHRSYRLFASLLMPVIAGTNTAFYLMVLLPIQLYEYH